MKPQITKLVGKNSGNTVAIFCGVHGDERAGIMVVDYLRRNLSISSGSVYLVNANPQAIQNNVRFTEKNLNRCFVDESRNGNTYEEKLAVELMELLDTCDALLDLHSYNEPSGDATPFIITEENSFDVIKNFNFSYVLTGIDNIEKGGTDAYMFNQGKIGICCELGAIEKPKKYFELGLETTMRFLEYFGLMPKQPSNAEVPKQVLKSKSLHKKKSEKFMFTGRYKTFDFVTKETHICTDGDEAIFAEEDFYILFPNDLYEVGVEVFLSASPK